MRLDRGIETLHVQDVRLRPSLCVAGTLDLVSVCRLLSLQGVNHALVQDGDRVGLFSAIDLRDGLLLPSPPAEVAVGCVARFDLPAVRLETTVIEVLQLMERHHRGALLARNEGGGFDVLEQSDLVRLMAALPYRVASDIEQAESVEQLCALAARVDEMVELQQSDGIRIERLASLVGGLNSSLLARLWSLVAPQDLERDSCLLVMGSEGRGEQIVKSDQDNALLLRDGCNFATLEGVAAEFKSALNRMGYPPCPGNVMLVNPVWRQPVGHFKDTLRRWVYGADLDGVMNLAIFFDARAVAGDSDLLVQARRFLHDSVVDNDAFFARFAAAAVQVGEDAGWWNRLALGRALEPETFDLKRSGTFPIVHGVRALALQNHVDALDTAERLRVLSERGVLTGAFSQDLVDALRFMMALRAQANLRQRALALPLENSVRLSGLSTLERETLRGSAAIVRSFRRHLQRHFRLDSL